MSKGKDILDFSKGRLHNHDEDIHIQGRDVHTYIAETSLHLGNSTEIAAEIVRRWNSHQKLVEAGQNLSETLSIFAAGVVGLDTVNRAQLIWADALAEKETK